MLPWAIWQSKLPVLAGLTAVLQWVMTAIHNRVCFCVTRDVRRQAFSHLQRLPLAYLDSHPSGDTLSRMIADVDQFADGLLMGFTQFFTGVLTIVGTLLFMLWMNPLITLVVVVITPGVAVRCELYRPQDLRHVQGAVRRPR